MTINFKGCTNEELSILQEIGYTDEMVQASVHYKKE